MRDRVDRQFLRIVNRLGERESQEEAAWVKPRPGSSMAHDDARTTYDRVSYQTHFFLGVAQDHLSTTREIIEDVGKVPPFALFSLARAALESAAYGVWI